MGVEDYHGHAQFCWVVGGIPHSVPASYAPAVAWSGGLSVTLHIPLLRLQKEGYLEGTVHWDSHISVSFCIAGAVAADVLNVADKVTVAVVTVVGVAMACWPVGCLQMV